MSFYVVWLLTALASVALGALPSPSRLAAVWGMAVGAVVVPVGWTVSSGGLAALVIALALCELIWLGRAPRQFTALARFGAAVLAMQASGHMAMSGVPMLIALLIGIVLALLPSWLYARSAAFAPARMHEEALLIVLTLGLVLAAAPEIESGWRSATALNANAVGSGDAAPIPMWALGALGATVLVGCISRMLRRS
jgi:hypothetical protein